MIEKEADFFFLPHLKITSQTLKYKKISQILYKIDCSWKTVNLIFNFESGGDIARIQNAIAFGEKNNNEVPDGRVRPLLSCPLRRVVLRSFRRRDRRFGGFCGAVDVRACFRGNVAGAFGEEITRQFDFGIFTGLRAVPRFEWNWIHDSRPVGAARSRAVSLSPVGFLKETPPRP